MEINKTDHPIEFRIMRLMGNNSQYHLIPTEEIYKALNKQEPTDKFQFSLAIDNLVKLNDCSTYFSEDGTKMIEFTMPAMRMYRMFSGK